jgi:hypothetical protein
MEHTWAEPVTPGAAVLIGDCPLSHFSPKIVLVLRDRKSKYPHAANGRVKNIRRVFKWALENELIGANPARDVQYLKTGGNGYHTWTDDEIAQFEKHWSIGSKPRLAFALLRYLGVRRSDVVRIGHQHIRGGSLRFTAFKGRNVTPSALDLPIPSTLQAIIDASDTGHMTSLLTDGNTSVRSSMVGRRSRGGDGTSRWIGRGGAGP